MKRTTASVTQLILEPGDTVGDLYDIFEDHLGDSPVAIVDGSVFILPGGDE